MTSNTDFKVTIQRQKTRKWYKIQLYLQWPTNKKSHLNGLGIYRSTLTQRYTTLMCAGAVAVLNVRMKVLVLRRSVLLLSDLTNVEAVCYTL